MDTFELFTKAGLDKKSAAVYAALLDKGVLSISQLSRETHINRPALYELLPRLQAAGLISQVQKQRRVFYKAESPLRILERFKDDHKETEELLADLAKEYDSHKHEKPVIKYFEGIRGVTFVFDDIAHTLPRGGVFYRYSSRTGDSNEMQNTHYAKVRDELGIERMVITSEAHAKTKKKKLERSIKAIPKEYDLFADNVSLVIYGDKTAYIDYDSKTSFIVESAKISRFQEKLFKLLYKKL